MTLPWGYILYSTWIMNMAMKWHVLMYVREYLLGDSCCSMSGEEGEPTSEYAGGGVSVIIDSWEHYPEGFTIMTVYNSMCVCVLTIFYWWYSAPTKRDRNFSSVHIDQFEHRYWKFNYWRFHWTTPCYIILHHQWKWPSKNVYLRKYVRNRAAYFLYFCACTWVYCSTFEFQRKSRVIVSLYWILKWQIIMLGIELLS